uniref:peptidyl-tRNA hydrolase n=1 Tax=Steinernema glaseri TaxID=37863 RepID=A0A1I8AU36_9BILA
MIFVVNMKLKMGVGKVAAQVGHATLGCYQAAERTAEGAQALDSWDYNGARKIVVKGNDTEHLIALQKAARDIGLFTCLIRDAGHTQVEPGSRTVLAIFGEVSEVDSVTKDLKLL